MAQKKTPHEIASELLQFLADSTYTLFLPLQLLLGLLHLMFPLTEGVVSGVPLCLQVSVGLTHSLTHLLPQSHGVLDLSLRGDSVVSREGAPLLRRHNSIQ